MPTLLAYRPLGGTSRALVTPGEWWVDHRNSDILRVEGATIRGGGRLFSSTFAVVASSGGSERPAFAKFQISDESEHGKLSRVDFF